MEPQQAAIDYLIPPPGYFWRWSEDGQAVEWADGSTLCLWPELHALLLHLAPGGLPPVGAVLMVLAACSRRTAETMEAAGSFAARIMGGHNPAPGSRNLLGGVGTVLKAVEELPAELRTGLQARAHLLERLFEGVPHRQPPAEAGEILEVTARWGMARLSPRQPGLTGKARLLRDLKSLIAVGERRSLVRLESLLRTGLESARLRPALLPEPEFPGPAEGRHIPLLRRLEEGPDRELAGVAAAAGRLVAMFSLPRPAGMPQELPVGGISDLTNRGTLDRLLPGELAADDGVLLARLANQEALYFRRDIPPGEQAVERLILMDDGVPLWGVPRLCILAGALGLREQAQARQAAGTPGAAAAARAMKVRVWRRQGAAFLPARLETEKEIRLELGELRPHPEPAEALAAFLPECPGGACPEVFFLTGMDLSADSRQALHGLASRVAETGGRLFVVRFSRTGAVMLASRTTAGEREIARGRLDPDLLLGGEGRKAEKPEAGSLVNLPALIRSLLVYRQHPLPFRFPAVRDPGSQLFHFAGWRLGVDRNRRLMMWDADGSKKPGAGEVAAGLPPARLYQIGVRGEEWVVLCSGLTPGERAVAVMIGMREATRREVRLMTSHPFPVWMKCQAGAAVLGYAGHAEACSLMDGHRLDRLELPPGTPSGKVVFDGASLALALGARDGFRKEEKEKNAAGPLLDRHGGAQVPGVPVSAGFAASGTLVIRAQGGRWELAVPEFVWRTSQKSQLQAVRPFRRIHESPRNAGEKSAAEEAAETIMADGYRKEAGPDSPEHSGEESEAGKGYGGAESGMPAFYLAEWNPDCRLVYDTRGLLHVLFADPRRSVQLTLLCVTGLRAAAWVAGWRQPRAGNPEWFVKPEPEPHEPLHLVPLMQAFGALARGQAAGGSGPLRGTGKGMP